MKLKLVLVSLLAVFTLVLPILFTMIPASPVQAATPIYVNAATGNDSYDGTSPTFVSGSVGPKLTIQAGINVVDIGGTVNVAAGTYVEQVIINRNLTLSGTANPLIKAPASPTGYTFPEGASNIWEPVVLAFGGTLVGSAISGPGQVTVNISGITVDGNARIPSPLSRRAVGILYRNVVGRIDYCTVQNMGYSTSGINSWGIMAYGTSDVIFHRNNVSGYAKGGFVVNGVAADQSMPKPNAIIDNNTVTGPPYSISMTLAPNGIQIGWGATGSITNNTVTQNGYPTIWGGTGILVMSSPNVLVEGNISTDNDYGIATSGYNAYGGRYATGTIIRNNTVTSNSEGIRVEGMANDTLMQNNTITANNYGIRVLLESKPIPPVGTIVHYNLIYCNTIGGFSNETVSIIDAVNNWWGCNDGPGVVGPGGGDKVSANVTYSPWLVLNLSANPPTIPADGVSTSIITADMTQNSSPGPSGGWVPDGSLITFAATGGTFNPLTKATANGIATTTFTAGLIPGLFTVTATAPSCNRTCASASVSVNICPLPTITAVNPASGPQGQTLSVIITGTNFGGATAVSFGAGITVNSFTANSDTQITANIIISDTAALGVRNISVTTPCNTGTLMGGFTVNAAPPPPPVNPSVGTGAPTSHGSSVGSQGTYGYSPPVGLPTIIVQSASLSAKIVTPGAPVTVTADIANKSTVNGNKKVTLYVNGQVESTQGITVNSGGSSQLTFSVSRSEPGDYSVYVDGVPAGSFKVELLRESDAILIFSATLVALAFLIGMVMLWRRQRTG